MRISFCNNVVTHGPALIFDDRVVPITRLRTRIGRGSAGFSPDIDLRQFGSGELVSRRQAELIFGERGIELVDQGSLNGTLLNGRELLPGQPSALRDGDAMEFVGIRAVFRRFASWPVALDVEWQAEPASAAGGSPEETILGRRWDGRLAT